MATVENQDNNNTNDQLSQKLLFFLRSPLASIEKFSIKMWHELSPNFPVLSKIALKYLSIVATSVPSERLFCQAGNIQTEKRNRLKGDKLTKQLFLHSIDKSYW